MKIPHIHICESQLSIDAVYRLILTDASGGNCLFVGTVRDHNKGHEVDKIEFSSYVPMSVAELTKISDEAKQKFDIHEVAVHHRIGTTTVQDIAVIIGVSSAHRKASFGACEYIIDELKKRVPIWKKEFRVDGQFWLGDRP